MTLVDVSGQPVADLHQRCLDAIAKRREESSAAGQRPWTQTGWDHTYVNAGRLLVTRVDYPMDATLIVSAANSFDAVTDLLTGIVERHSPVEWYEETEVGSEEYDLDRLLPPFCRHCTDEECVSAVESGVIIDLTTDVESWPCVDYLAAARALGVEGMES